MRALCIIAAVALVTGCAAAPPLPAGWVWITGTSLTETTLYLEIATGCTLTVENKTGAVTKRCADPSPQQSEGK